MNGVPLCGYVCVTPLPASELCPNTVRFSSTPSFIKPCNIGYTVTYGLSSLFKSEKYMNVQCTSVMVFCLPRSTNDICFLDIELYIFELPL